MGYISRFIFAGIDPETKTTFFMVKGNSQEGVLRNHYKLNASGLYSIKPDNQVIASIDPSRLETSFFERVTHDLITSDFANKWIAENTAGFINDDEGRMRDLRFAHFGNGLVCYDRNQVEHGDYARIAHISSRRVIKYYKKLSNFDYFSIENEAAFSHPNISTTQDQKVFGCDPCEHYDVRQYQVILEHYNSGMVFSVLSEEGEPVTDGHNSVRNAVLELNKIQNRKPSSK